MIWNYSNGAELNIIFCLIHQFTLFTFISIDGLTFKTTNDFTLFLNFDELEKELGKKVCRIELFNDDKGKKISRSFYIEIYLGFNRAYCFLDNVGTTYEFIFYRKNIKSFLDNNKFYIYSKEFKKAIFVKPNSYGLNDRSNLILINCIQSTNLVINNKNEIDLRKFSSSIKNFFCDNSYFLFYNNEDFDKIISREIRPIDRLNFYDIYDKKKGIVENIYEKIISIINEAKDISYEKYELIFKDYKSLIDIMYNNYVLPKTILQKELNKIEYIEFIFKLVVFSCINREFEKKGKKEKIIDISQIKSLRDKLNNAYVKIKNDKEIEIYEKILLLINIYLSKYFKNNKEIEYYNLKNIDKESPLALSIQFLDDFIEKLDYDSEFYYPLLLIDGGLFHFKYKNEWLRTFGANMNTIQYIKKHLKNLIPNVIIYSNTFEKKNKDDYAYIMPQTGIITLNIELLGKNFEKKEADENTRKHKAFLLFRILFHELFAHKKSSFSKDYTGTDPSNPLSANCFKDYFDGKFRFLPDENNDNIFKDIDELAIGEIEDSKGESGYFLEYFFGKINDQYILDILDEYENKINLGILLDANLLHKRINEFREYIRLQKYLVDENINVLITANNITEQIVQMKNRILKREKTSEKKNSFEISKIEFNFLKENKDDLKDKEVKKKRKPKYKGSIFEGKEEKVDNLFQSAFNPFNIDKVLELTEKYPNAFYKK